jgi:hypothetical protein
MLLSLAQIFGTSISWGIVLVAFDVPPSPPGGASTLAIIPFLLAVFAFVTVVIFLWIRKRR